MLKAVLISFILLTQAYAQDDDLAILESSFQADTDTAPTNTRVKKSRWSIKRSDPGRETDNDKEGRPLDLRSVLEEGFRRNPLEKIRVQQREQIELMYFKSFGILRLDSNYRVLITELTAFMIRGKILLVWGPKKLRLEALV